MDLYTIVLRKSGKNWVALCLENGLAGQGISKKKAVEKLKEAIESFEEVYQTEADVYKSPISVKELHEFLKVEEDEPDTGTYELRAVYA